MNTRMDRSRLNIGTYILRPYARSEKHIKELKEAGIDFVVSMNNDRRTLDLFSKYGIGAIVNDALPWWWGGDGSKAGQLEATNPMHKYEDAVKSFLDHPAIWSIDIGDEPSALDFPYYGKVYDRINELFPKQFPYINLYPNYASVAQNNTEQTLCQLGTATYEEYIEEFCRNFSSDYLCYDFYLYSGGVGPHYENLRAVTEACHRTNRSMWIVLQVNSQDARRWISLNNLRFQAYTAMAFGAENIIWACYTAGWWYNQVLDNEGNKTEQYGKLKTVNREIRAMADEYMRFKNLTTHFVGFYGRPEMQSLKREPIDSVSTDAFLELHAEDGSPLVVGEMTSRTADGASALMICPADDPQDENPKQSRIVFRISDKVTVRALGGSGELELAKEQDGRLAVSVISNEGILLIAEAK